MMKESIQKAQKHEHIQSKAYQILKRMELV
jgi:hypothetical protein